MSDNPNGFGEVVVKNLQSVGFFTTKYWWNTDYQFPNPFHGQNFLKHIGLL